MKSTLFTFSLIVLTINCGFSQLSIGPSVGGVFTRFNIKPPSGQSLIFEDKIRLGIRLGVQTNYQLSSETALQGGIHFIQKGDRVLLLNYNPTRIDNQRFSYLELPLLYKRSVKKFSKAQLNIMAGGYYAFLVEARLIEYYPGYKRVSDSDTQSVDKKYDAGLLAGLSLDHQLQHGKVQTAIQFEQGLVNVFGYYKRAMTSCISLSTTYFFNLKN